MVHVYWCRSCKRQTYQDHGRWMPKGEVIKRPKVAEIVVCTLCFLRARLNHGVDLSRPRP